MKTENAMRKVSVLLTTLLFLSLAQVPAAQRSTVVDQQSLAESDTLITYQLPEIVVTATRLERDPASVGRSVSVISTEAIRSNIPLSVGEVLTKQEGIYTVGAGQNPGMTQSIFMRGSSSNHTTILVDDIRLTDPSGVNNALDLSELSFAGVDRIEIVRGSHSTLYGSSAIGGVVNIITEKNRLPGLHAAAEIRGGMFGKSTSLLDQALNLNYTHPLGLYFNAHVQNHAVNGLDATIDTIQSAGVFKNRDRDNFRKVDIGGKIGFRADELEAHVSYEMTGHKTDIDDGAFRDDENHRLRFSRALLTYGGSYAINPQFSLKAVGGYSRMEREVVDDSSVVDQAGNTDGTHYRGKWSGTTLTNELQADFRLPYLDFVGGIGSYRETMSSRSRYFANTAFGPFEVLTDLDSLRLNATTLNVFAHVDVNGGFVNSLLRRFGMGLGVRANRHSAFGTHLTYEINPSVRILEGGLLYGSASTGFNAPSLYQLFSPEQDFTSGITLGNRELKPERSMSYEIGLKHSARSWQFSLSFFKTVIEDAIEFVYLWDKNVGLDTLGNDWMRNDFRGLTYLNIGTQTTNGIEVRFHVELTTGFFLSGNASFLSGRLRYRPDEIDTRKTQNHHVQIFNSGAFLNREVEISSLTRRPNTLNLSLDYSPLESWSLRLDVRHVGSRYDNFFDSQRGPYGALGALPVGEYTLVDFMQRFQLGDNVSISARLENIFNERYAEINGFTTRGRGVFLSLRYAFHHEL